MERRLISLKHGNDPDSRFNRVQLRIGTRIEREHTGSPAVAKAIAKAHLAETPSYYIKLKKAGL